MQQSVSYYPVRLEDSQAVYPGEGELRVHGDGVGDDAPAIQAAIDLVQERQRTGIVFVPSGVYRLGATLDLWRGIRLIGHGPTRPVFVLGRATAGFDGAESKYMVHFRDARPRDGRPAGDAKNTTFYSGINNIDFRIEEGNPSAVAVRFRVAQLSSLEHIDFEIGSAKAAVEAIGNEIEDCRFAGGRYGILTAGGTSAGWQSLVMDCIFEGQEKACIQSDRAGLTIVRCIFRRAARAIHVPYDCVEQVFMRDCVIEDVEEALSLSAQSKPANQVNLEIVVCANVRAVLKFRPSNDATRVAAPIFRVERLSHGLHIDPKAPALGARRQETRVEHEVLAELPPVSARDYPEMPAREAWVNVRDLGAMGDGVSDDTEALRAAIAQHRAVYLPMGRYLLSDTVELRPDTALIGLHCDKTQLILASGTNGFGDAENPRPMLVTPAGGRNIVSGLCVNPNRNRGAIAVKWMAGEESLMDDVWFEWGGHGKQPKGEDFVHSLWVTSGGGGTFKNVWSPNVCARTGVYVSETSTPGRVYLMSVEHHRDVEVKLDRVSNWHFYALQTEENPGSEKATAVDMAGCSDVEFANLFLYRVMAVKEAHPHAVAMRECRRIVFRGLHCFSWGRYPFDNAVYDASGGAVIPERELTQVEMP